MMDTLQKLTQDLIRCASVTPETAGVFDVLRAHLEPLGFECHTLSAKNSRDEMITSLFARYGSGAPHFCFAGHVDVVPTGKLEDWTHPPFSAHIEQDVLYGRGASDMKGAVAAFAIAAQDFMARNTDFGGSISLLIAGDEEATGAVGTDEALKWLKQTNGLPDLCLVGEPTNPDTLGQMIKVGAHGQISVAGQDSPRTFVLTRFVQRRASRAVAKGPMPVRVPRPAIGQQWRGTRPAKRAGHHR